jgi:hypothetical protein
MIDTSTPTSTRQRQAQELKERARSIYLANRALGWDMTGAELGEACDGRSDRWGRKRIEEILEAEARTTAASSPVPVEESEPAEPHRHDTTPTAAESTSLPPIVTPPTAVEPSPVAVAEESEPEPEPSEPERKATGTAPVKRPPHVWPVALLMLPATVAIWSGWVGLGELAGFGPVRPLPGIVDSFEINSAITLPVGMEVYAAYAMYVWLSGRAPARAQRMARTSAILSLVIGALGQVAYHVMVAAGVTVAPWWITAGVACLPVAVLGMGAALAHMVRAEAGSFRVDADPGPVEPVA